MNQLQFLFKLYRPPTLPLSSRDNGHWQANQSNQLPTEFPRIRCLTGPPFFLEGDSVLGPTSPKSSPIWAAEAAAGAAGRLFEGVEVNTPLGTISNSDSVGVLGVTGVRGSGLTMVQPGVPEASSLSSVCMASELRMTLKWVFSEGIMVTVFGSSTFSFFETWKLHFW